MKEEYKDKTKEQLINELVELRQRIAELEASENERKQVEERLKLFSHSVESSIDGIATGDFDNRITYVNEAFATMFGYSRAELVGKEIASIYTEDQMPKLEKALRVTIKGDWTGELIGKRKNGAHFPIAISSSRILDDEGKTIAHWTIQRDITERKRMEEELRLFSQAADSSPDGIAMGNFEGRITYVNETFVRMFGYSKEELIGKEIAFVYSKDQIPKLEEALKATMEGGWTGELVGKRKNGELFPMAISSAVVMDEEGRVIAHMASHSDITERMRAEEALQESEEKYRTFIERTSEGYWGLNSEHKTSEVNQSLCDMLGYKKEEMMGKSPHDFVDEENLKIFKYQMGKIESTLNRSYEITLKKKSGEGVFTRFNATTIIDDTGEFKGAYALVTDITELKKAEEALRESSAKIRSITASAHDAVIMVDDEENISFWNEAAERIFGYSEEEMIRTKLHDSIIPERFREDALNGFKSFRETGQGAAVGKTLELAANRKDGTELPVELSLSAVKIKGKWNAIGVIRDISERKQAEEKLMKKTEELERFNKLAVGRELKMIELKKEINAFLEQLGKEPRYKIVGES